MNAAADQQSLRLGLLLQLEHRARRAAPAELAFVMVNETAQVAAYEQAALWQSGAEGSGGGRLVALSGAAEFDPHGPYARWLNRVCAAVALAGGGEDPQQLTPADLPAELAADWSAWLPAEVLWVPLARSGGMPLGGLLIARAVPWGEGERQLLGLLAEHYAQCWILSHLPKMRVPWAAGIKRRRLALATILVALLVVALLPVRISALVPAEVVPIEPLQVRAPFEGVVDAVLVEPNAHVTAGQKLVSLETAQLRTRQRVAVKAREIAEAEYGQAAQQAMSEDKAKGKLSLLRAKIEQQAAEVAYVDDLLARADLAAPADGIAIFDTPAEWIGKPVSVGERIMLVADPGRVELELQVPVAEAVTFDEGADVAFFRNVAPERPVAARVAFASYAANVTAEGVAAYRFRARFSDGGDLRIGLKGTAKLYGPRRPLALWLLRRPLAVVRQWLTL